MGEEFFLDVFLNGNLSKYLFDDLSMNISQSEFSTLKSIGQLLMIKTEQMEPKHYSGGDNGEG